MPVWWRGQGRYLLNLHNAMQRRISIFKSSKLLVFTLVFFFFLFLPIYPDQRVYRWNIPGGNARISNKNCKLQLQDGMRRTWRLHHFKHARAGHASVWEHLGEAAQSMNWSNPGLRWGHASQPIRLLLGIRHTALNQSKRLCFSFFSPPLHTHTLTMLSPSLLLARFHSFSNTILASGDTPLPSRPPRIGGNGQLFVSKSQTFCVFFLFVFFWSKALAFVSLGLVPPRHCVWLIHSQSTQWQGWEVAG